MRKFSTHKWWMLTVLLTVPALAIAAVPNLFTAGTLISASQVNLNFLDLDARLEALEAVPRVKVIGVAKVAGTTVQTFSGNGITSVTSTLEADGSLDITFNGNFADLPLNRLIVFASADANNSQFNVANGRIMAWGLNAITVQAAIFRSNTAVISPNATINVMIVSP